MTDIYKSLEDSIYNVVIALFPDWRIKFAYDNGPELQTPFLAIDVRTIDAEGREESHFNPDLQEDGKTYATTIQNYVALVRFEFTGKYDANLQLAEMAQMLDFGLQTPKGYEEQERNALAIRGKKPVRRLRLPRETDTFMYYQLDVSFGFSVTQSQEQDYFEAVGIHGVYHDAGREPDHIIRTNIDITPT